MHCQRKNLKNAPLILKAMYCKYAAIAIIPRPKLVSNKDKKITIDKFSINDSYHQLHFKKECVMPLGLRPRNKK